jgi:FecR protein
MSSRSIFQSYRATLALLVLLSVLGVSVALADDESDPPGRVARLSYASGSVSLQPAGVEDWTDATLNRPLTTGDKLWTDQNSRAELDIGSAVIRLGSTTGFSLLNLDDRTAQMNITAGTAIVHVRDRGEDQLFEVDTPNVAIALQSPGDYRVEVNDAGDTTVVKVATGDAEVSATGQTVPLHTQQASTFTGTDQVTADATSVGAPDTLDSWSLDRDRRSEQAQAQTSDYVSPDVAGVDDLAEYGTWQTTPDYGPVWTPTVVAAGWSPYHFGSWVWIAPWGWTWVDEAPWGFAPFHYGRWAYVGTRWCWVPGPRYVRPVYAPALVGWVGSPGATVSITVGGGRGVGWFPLGPREVYVPAYRVSRNYVRNVNVTNTTIVNTTYITNVYENRVTNVTYANRNRPGAVVAVSQDVFTSARPISGHTMRIPEHDLSRFGARPVAPAIAPGRESVLGHRPEINVRRPPAAIVNRPVVARTAPPPAPVPFARQQEAIRANGGRPLERAQLMALQPAAATNPRVRVVARGPVRPIEGREQPGSGGQQFGTARSMQERERALHATPIAPSQQNPRPGDTSTFGTNRGPALRNDRPPASQQMRQNDQYRMQNNEESRRQAQEVRPTPQGRAIEPRAIEQREGPQARPIEQPRESPQARPTEQSRQFPQGRPSEQPRAVEQSRTFEQSRSFQQPRAEQPRDEQPRTVPQARPIEQPRAFPQPRQIEQPRQEFQQPRQEYRAPEPQREIREQPRPIQRPVEQPRAEPRQMEAPRAAPPPQPRQAPQQQQRTEDRRGGRPGEPRNRQ